MSIAGVSYDDIGRTMVNKSSKYKYILKSIASINMIVETPYGNEYNLYNYELGGYYWEDDDLVTPPNTKQQRKLAAKQLRDAYDKCRELDMDICADNKSLHICYETPVEEY